MPKSLKQFLWFATIWTASVASLTLVSFAIRAVLH